MAQNILVTGASSGFGRLITETLLKRGHTVVASMRGTTEKNRTAADGLQAAGAKVVEIDVTREESVNQGVADAIQAAGRLDVVVNNAGVGVLGLQESFTPADWQKIFDVNLFGVQRVNRAVLPHLRDRRAGLLIHVTSLLGRFTIPFYGPYNASKWALEALTENYRVELSGLGIDVCLVEPGGFPTTFHDNLVKPSDASRDAGYGELARAPEMSVASFRKALQANPAQDPQLVADAVAALVDTPPGQRPFRTVVDKMGMGDALQSYNEQQEQITHGIYKGLGIESMLTLKVS
ncbi:MAG: SDR family oxidoreductase [Desulfobacterales bacterium]|nr:SDR family oxidoreductase [Desulfobacterales bacterium]